MVDTVSMPTPMRVTAARVVAQATPRRAEAAGIRHPRTDNHTAVGPPTVGLAVKTMVHNTAATGVILRTTTK